MYPKSYIYCDFQHNIKENLFLFFFMKKKCEQVGEDQYTNQNCAVCILYKQPL